MKTAIAFLILIGVFIGSVVATVGFLVAAAFTPGAPLLQGALVFVVLGLAALIGAMLLGEHLDRPTDMRSGWERKAK